MRYFYVICDGYQFLLLLFSFPNFIYKKRREVCSWWSRLYSIYERELSNSNFHLYFFCFPPLLDMCYRYQKGGEYGFMGFNDF